MMKTEFVAAGKFTETQKLALDKLWAAIYPPEVIETLPSRPFSWAPPQWSILLWDENELVTRVGLLVREIYDEGKVVTIGGIGGVMTHPDRQRQGLASRAMREAVKRFDSELNVSYALLFCRPKLVEFYKRLMWKPFQGKVYVEQPGGKIEFTVNGAMVIDIKEEAPVNGKIDLNGLPW